MGNVSCNTPFHFPNNSQSNFKVQDIQFNWKYLKIYCNISFEQCVSKDISCSPIIKNILVNKCTYIIHPIRGNTLISFEFVLHQLVFMPLNNGNSMWWWKNLWSNLCSPFQLYWSRNYVNYLKPKTLSRVFDRS